MPKASNAWTRWGVTATTLLLATCGLTAVASPASAQAAPTPAPNPLASLLPELLAPLAPILHPSPQPTAGAGQPGTNPAAGTGTGSGPGIPAPVIPKQVEVHCGGVPRPLVFARTPGRTTQPLIDAAQKLTPPGGSLQATLLRVAAPFPVAGSAAYRDDWGEPRTTPCPHLHQGNDIFANFGTPVVAPEAGTIERYGFESVGGNSVYFMGDDGYGIYGAHLQSFAADLRVGAHVAAGTELGFVGNTGDAAGGSPHLHFQLYPPGHAWGSPVDPKFWLDANLDHAISAAGGVVPIEGPAVLTPEQQPVNVGGLMNSVLLAGGHIITQPTVPVILLVLLVLGTLGMAQTRTFKVAADRRRSRSSADVPAFLVGGVSGVVRATPAVGRRGKRRAAAAAVAQPDDRPAWARSAVPAQVVEKKPSVAVRFVGALGDTWGSLPERMSGVSSTGSTKKATALKTAAFSPPPNGHVNANGHDSFGNGSSGHPNGNGGAKGKGESGSLHSWTPTSTGLRSGRK